MNQKYFRLSANARAEASRTSSRAQTTQVGWHYFPSALGACLMLSLMYGCAHGPWQSSAVPLTAQTPFEQLQKNALASSSGASIPKDPDFIRWFPSSAQDAVAADATRIRLGDEFKNWCQLRNGLHFSLEDRNYVGEPIQSARSSNNYLTGQARMDTLDTKTCQVGSEFYLLNIARARNIPRPDASSTYGYEGYRFAWVSPKDLVKSAKARIEDDSRQVEAVNKQESDSRARAEKRAAAEIEGRRIQTAQTNLLRDSPKGTALACDASVLAQGMSAPLSRVQMHCGGFRITMSEMIQSGWQQVSMSWVPDGDFGGIARTHYDIMFRKM